MTTELATVDGEIIDGVLPQPSAPITLFGTDHPGEVVERASAIATALADVINRKNLYKRIGTRNHVFVEGWTLLGSMLGVFAEIEWSRPLDDGWESRAVSRTLNGRVVGAAESMCSRRESKWRSADDYAIRSMAQTRAVSKALRLPLGFIMELAGYSATPAEELTEPKARSRANGPAEPDGREAPVAMAADTSAEAGKGSGTADPDPALTPQDGLPAMPGAEVVSEDGSLTDQAMRARYEWATRLGWTADTLDQAAVDAIGCTVMEMGNADWTAFATTIKAKAILPPPPTYGTAEYKALPVSEKAAARAYWADRKAAT